MKKIIERKMYNTETAKLIGTYDSSKSPNAEEGVYEELYRKENGEFFIYGKGNESSALGVPNVEGYCPNGEYCHVLDEDSAKDWIMWYLDADVYIELFGEPEE